MVTRQISLLHVFVCFFGYDRAQNTIALLLFFALKQAVTLDLMTPTPSSSVAYSD